MTIYVSYKKNKTTLHKIANFYIKINYKLEYFLVFSEKYCFAR